MGASSPPRRQRPAAGERAGRSLKRNDDDALHDTSGALVALERAIVDELLIELLGDNSGRWIQRAGELGLGEEHFIHRATRMVFASARAVTEKSGTLSWALLWKEIEQRGGERVVDRLWFGDLIDRAIESDPDPRLLEALVSALLGLRRRAEVRLERARSID